MIFIKQVNFVKPINICMADIAIPYTENGMLQDG